MMKFFGRTKRLTEKIKNGENVQSPEVVKVSLIRCYLVNNQYHEKSQILYGFKSNKS